MSAKKVLDSGSKESKKYGLTMSEKDYTTSKELMIEIQKSLPQFVKVKFSRAY
jgi:hypothetical protein